VEGVEEGTGVLLTEGIGPRRDDDGARAIMDEMNDAHTHVSNKIKTWMR
jgi:hypothetical protein